MRYAQIKNGVVANIIVCEPEVAHLFSDGFDDFVEVGDGVSDAKIGQGYDQLTNTFSVKSKTPEQLAKENERKLKKQQDATLKTEFEAFKAWKASQS
jgi:hypothetical protein